MGTALHSLLESFDLLLLLSPEVCLQIWQACHELCQELLSGFADIIVRRLRILATPSGRNAAATVVKVRIITPPSIGRRSIDCYSSVGL
jgi:hypothetical protein